MTENWQAMKFRHQQEKFDLILSALKRSDTISDAAKLINCERATMYRFIRLMTQEELDQISHIKRLS